MQTSFVFTDCVRVESGQVVEAGAQADHAGDWRGTGFKAQRRRAEAGLVIVSQLDHLSAELPVAQACQRFTAAVEHANAVWAIQLVAGEHIEVASQLLHVLTAMHDTLGTVDYRQRPLGMCVGQQRSQRLPGAEHVGQLAHCQQSGARAGQLQGNFEIDQTAVVQGQNYQFEAAALGQLLPRQQIGVVFQRADGDFITGFEQALKPIGQQVQG
ncbi:hypothetical protein D3C84_793460 [compost metagenome]